MAPSAIVQFRRHLAFCALTLLLVELVRRNAGQQPRAFVLTAAATPTSGAIIARDGHNTALPSAFNAPSRQARHAHFAGTTLNDDSDDRTLIQITLDWLGEYMPKINLNYTLRSGRRFEHYQLDDDVEEYYKENFSPNMTVDELQLLSVEAAIRLAPMPLHNSWGYESEEQLKVSSAPVQSDTRCQAHLNQLNERLRRMTTLSANTNQSPSSRKSAYEATPVENLEAQLIYRAQDIQFARYLDTFGRVPNDVLRGNVKWYGSYAACMDTRLNADWRQGGTKRIRFRYCLAGLKSTSWPSSAEAQKEQQQGDNYGVHSTTLQRDAFFLRVGVCLPEACDSRATQTSAENGVIIERLLKFNLLKPFNSDHYYLSDLYCLPDERSPLRSIPMAGKLLLVVSLAWLALIGLASAVHLNVERFYRKAVKEIRRQDAEGIVSFDGDEDEDEDEQQQQQKLTSGNGGQRSKVIVKGNKKNDEANNEFREMDVLGIKRRWLRLNVHIFDRAKRLVPGVDLIDCLSLYSNWLRYTKRMKLAVAQLYADEQRRERRRARNAALIDDARKRAAGRATCDSDDRSKKQVTSADELAAERELSRRDDLEELESDTVKRRVDTASLNALKVIALIWIIAGHCIFYLGSAVSDGALLKNYVRDLAAFALANGAMYIVELFFVITGCLTTYLAFKLNSVERSSELVVVDDRAGSDQSSSDDSESKGNGNKDTTTTTATTVYLEPRMFKPTFWMGICLHRYLRILPTYLLVYAYVKLVSVYVGGRGPTWDYAVSGNSMRRKCVEESWLPVLTLTSNFVQIYDHCVVGGWYLSVDMQFMLMSVPIMIMLALCQRRRSGSGSNNSNKLVGSQFVAFSKQNSAAVVTTTAASVTTSSGQVHLTGANLDNNNSSSRSKQQQQQQQNSTTTTLVPLQPPNKSLWIGYALVVALGLLSALLAILFGIYQSQVDLAILLRFVPHAVSVLSRSIAMYTNSVFRFRAFAFGLILGHLLYLYQFKLLELPKFIQQHGAKLTTIIFSVGFSIMFLPVLYPANKVVLSHDTTVIAMILAAGGIDIFLCVLIFLICIGKAPKAVLFILNSPGWSLFSSLSLCAFVIHTEIIALLTSQLMPLPNVTYWLLLYIFSATILLTYASAFVLYLTFEMPFCRLLEGLLIKCLAGGEKPTITSAGGMRENPAAIGGRRRG